MLKKRRRGTAPAQAENSSDAEDNELLQQILADLSGVEQLQEFQGRLVREMRRQLGALQRRRKQARPRGRTRS